MNTRLGLVSAAAAGLRAGLGLGPTLTYDNDPESPRSVAFDRAMNLGERLVLTRLVWRGGPCGALQDEWS